MLQPWDTMSLMQATSRLGSYGTGPDVIRKEAWSFYSKFGPLGFGADVLVLGASEVAQDLTAREFREQWLQFPFHEFCLSLKNILTLGNRNSTNQGT